MLQLPSRGVFVVCFLLCLFCFNIEIEPTKWTAFAALALECILKQLRSAYFYVFFLYFLCACSACWLLFFFSTEFQKFQQFLFASTRHLALWTAHVCARVCVSGVCGCPYVCIINQIFYIHLCVCLSVICMCFFHSLSLSAFYLCLSRFDVALAFVHLCLRVGRGCLASDSLLINSISCHLPLFSWSAHISYHFLFLLPPIPPSPVAVA